jgi:hypothetical protein
VTRLAAGTETGGAALLLFQCLDVFFTVLKICVPYLMHASTRTLRGSEQLNKHSKQYMLTRRAAPLPNHGFL